MNTVALLTLDRGSILYNPDQMPSEIVLKHVDGELIKIERDGQASWLSKRREELEINFWQDGEYESTTDAVATLADRQAFGFRLNGEAINPLSPGITSITSETIEIEGLDLGGVLFEDNRQLPFAVYTKDEVYYRVYLTEEEKRGSAFAVEVAVLEKREGPRGEWREIGRTESTEVGHLIETVADETDMEAVRGDAGDLQETIDDQQELFQASRTAGDENVRERAAIQNKTVFDPSIPQPRPVTFPTRQE
jgi:hypothetical protein